MTTQTTQTTRAIEIHGKEHCPYAWRARLAARLKGVAYDWIASDPNDSATRDPRSETHNPDDKSPLLWDDGFSLIESTVIAQFIDESRTGDALRPLQPIEVKARAQQRVAVVEAGGLMVPMPEMPAPPHLDKKVALAQAALEKRLSDGRTFVDGDAPGMVDLHVWPALALQASRNIPIAPEHTKVRAYWERSKAHEAYAFTKPFWA